MTVTLVDMESGETFSLVGLGSGQDSGDKAVMKAQTASMKYAYLLSLAISTGDDPEADAQTDEHSNGAQVRAIREFAKGHNIIIVDQYIDRARSATTDDRPAFQQMIEDSAKGNFEIVLVHKLDRFARNRNDSSVYRLKLHKNKVKLLSVMEPLDDERPESIILQSTLEAMAEYYSINLAREVRKGMKENALKAKHTGGRPSLGYDVDRVTKELVINENEAAAVRLICLQRQVAEVEQKEGNLLSLLAPPGKVSERQERILLDSLEHMDADKRKLQEEIEQLRIAMDVAVPSQQELERYFQKARKQFRDRTLKEQQALVDAFVEKIIVHGDEVEVILNLVSFLYRRAFTRDVQTVTRRQLHAMYHA